MVPEAPPGLNSCTRPATRTASPTATVGADDVKTKMPSDVASFASGLGSCIQNPFELVAVTTAGRVETVSPTCGETCAAP